MRASIVKDEYESPGRQARDTVRFPHVLLFRVPRKLRVSRPVGAVNRVNFFLLARQLAAAAAPRSVRFHFSPYPLDASGESRRTRFEILQGLVRQLNGIDFASILVVLYPRLPACLFACLAGWLADWLVGCLPAAARTTCFANAYIFSLYETRPPPGFIFHTGTRKSRGKCKT